jgi:hypothetical protein
MAKLILVGVGALLLLGLVLAWQPQPDAYRDYVQMEQARMQLAQQAADNARAAAFWDTALPLLGVLAGVVLAGGIFFAFIALWERRRPLVQLDALAVPVDRRALHAGAYSQIPYAILEHRTQAAISAGQTPPHTYSPHIVYQNRSETGQPGAAQLAGPAFQAPSIGEAAEQGAFRDGRYILGYKVADGAPVTLDQEQGRSLLIAGQGGSGGTTALLAAALQEVLMPRYLPGQAEPARFIVVDYHARKPQGLLQRIGDELGDRVLYAAHKPAEVERAVRMFEAECRARVEGAASPYPLILLCDEVGNMIDDADYDGVVPGLLGAFKHANNAYRAVGGKAIVRGHTLQASAWGNSAAIRGSFHARAGMRLDEGAGVLLGLKPAIARTLLALPAGQSYVTGPGLAPTHVVSSNVRKGDMGTVLDLAGYRAKGRTVHPAPNLPNSAPKKEGAPNSAPDEDRGVLLEGEWWARIVPPEGNADSTPESALEGNSEGSPEGKRTASGQQADGSPEGNPGNPQAVRIYCLFMAGQPLPAVVEAVYGVSSTNGGRKYQAAMQEAQQLLRAEIARRRAQPARGEAI